MMIKCHPSIAIVGASGLVGQEAIKILQSRNHQADKLSLFGSNRSSGTVVEYLDQHLHIHNLNELNEFRYDFVLNCANAEVAKTVRQMLANSQINANTVLIDNSSAFRADQDVPLVLPEVNPEALNAQVRVIANPNCSTIMLLAAVHPLREIYGVSRIIVTTYQAVSGAGVAGIKELHTQTKRYLNAEQCKPRVFPASCAFNVFEHESEIDPVTGFNGEESKIISESRRILQDPTLSILPTCVRVPVERAHSQSVIVELKAPATPQEARAVLRNAGIRSRLSSKPLTPRDVAGTDDVFVGRIRIDPQSDGKRLLLWICADQIRKGAALNAIQIMDSMQDLITNPLCPV